MLLNPGMPKPPISQKLIIEEEVPHAWDSIVSTHPDGSIYHTSGWQAVLEEAFDHITACFIGITDTLGQITAGMPIYLVSSPIIGKRLISIPFATFVTPILSEQKHLALLLDGAQELLQRNRCKFIEIRYSNRRPWSDPAWAYDKGFDITINYVYHYVDIIQPEKLIYKFSRKAVRQPIYRALKLNYTVKTGATNQLLDDFYPIYVKSRKRLGLPPQPKRFFKTILKYLGPKNRAEFIMAYLDGKALGGILAYRFNGLYSMEYGAVDHAAHKAYPAHFLYWTAICRAFEHGFKRLDFGRTSKNNQGLLSFKRRWGTVESDLPSLIYPQNAKPKTSPRGITYSCIRKLIKASPIWMAEKVIGRFLYRHLG